MCYLSHESLVRVLRLVNPAAASAVREALKEWSVKDPMLERRGEWWKEEAELAKAMDQHVKAALATHKKKQPELQGRLKALTEEAEQREHRLCEESQRRLQVRW